MIFFALFQNFEKSFVDYQRFINRTKDVITPKVDLIPDYNHDRKIDTADRDFYKSGEPYRFWVNDDNDYGDIKDVNADIPGEGTKNHTNAVVDGRSDLVDFFPVHLDLKSILEILPTDEGAEYKLCQDDGALKFVYTDLTASDSGNFLITDAAFYGSAFDKEAHEADTISITASGVTLTDTFLAKILADETKGILLMEGTAESTKPLVIEVWKDGAKVFEKELPLVISGVEKMFTTANIRAVVDGGNTVITAAENITTNEDLKVEKHFVFVHGYNSNERQGRGWASEIFKRMYWSGSLAHFHGVLWNGSESQLVDSVPATDYHSNADNAFQSAPALRNYLNSLNDSGTPVTVAAHSLGSMLASSTLCDSQIKVATNYFMLNAAVASEAYDGTETIVKDMWHNNWEDYYDAWDAEGLPAEDKQKYYRLTAAGWHSIFDGADGRSELTWKDRFSENSLGVNFYNFYSSGEEVLDLHPFDDSVSFLLYLGKIAVGIDPPAARYVWAMQEKLKGMMEISFILGSSYGGWDWNNSEYWNYNVADAFALTDEALKTQPYFDDGGPYVDLYNANQILASNHATANRDAILSRMIPALTPAAGKIAVTGLNPPVGDPRNFNMQDDFQDDTVWPQERLANQDEDLKTAWYHSDLKDVAYLYVYGIYDRMTELGNFKQ